MRFRWLIIAFVLLTVCFAAWIFWQRPQRVEMANYVPSDALVYLEANDLPQILGAYASTSAWQELAPQYNISKNFGEFSAFSRFLADADIGSNETVVFGRSQIAVALTAVQASAGGEESVRVKPRYAVIIETKTSQSTAQYFVDKQLADFAKKQFGEIKVEKSEREGVNWTLFRSANDERKLYAAVNGGTIFFGNDETPVKSCLDAKNELRPSLAQSPRLAEMRERVEAANGFAFGFVTSEGIKSLSQLGAVLFAGQITEEPAAMSLIAQSLPPMIEKTATGIAWSAREMSGNIQDRYFVAMPNDLTTALREPLAVSGQPNYNSSALLPQNAYSVTIYNFKNAGAAWRGLVLAISTKLDALAAAAFAQTAGKLLEPYGVSKANDFLSAASDEMTTARLTEKENETVAIVKVGDENKMRAALETKNENRSAIFSGGMLVLGETEDVEKCLAAQSQNLANANIWREFTNTKLISGSPFVRTFTRDAESATNFVRIFADETRKKETTVNLKNPDAFVSFSETGWRENGFERSTRSSFGLIGTLATSFAE